MELKVFSSGATQIVLLSSQITKDESSRVTLRHPTPRLLRLVWLEEGCARFFSICWSVPCRCTFQQPRRSPRRVVVHAIGMASGYPNQIHGSWKEFHGHQHRILQKGEKTPHGLSQENIVYIEYFHIEIFIYFHNNESCQCALAKSFF